MSDYKIQWNISLPPVAQYAKGHMLNLACESLEELNAYLDELETSDTLEKAVGVAAKLAALSGVAEKLGGTVESVSQNTAQSSSESGATVTQLRTCQHGKRDYRVGGGGSTGKKAWAGYFCPEKNKLQQCDVDWVDNK